MAKYTVAVCDDEKEDLSFIVRKITEYDTHQLFEIKTYTDGELLFDELKSQKTSIDLLLWTQRCHPMDFNLHELYKLCQSIQW